MRVDLLPLWLTDIRVKAARDEIQSKLERFKHEAAKILWEAFQEGRLTVGQSFDDLLAGASPETIQAYQVAQAV